MATLRRFGWPQHFHDNYKAEVVKGYKKNKRPFSPNQNLLRNGLVANLTCN
ncbi:hypothetical protein [Nitrosomonas communis]|uniref:hypothetical protein n=1 Tax=Nitrosomonas communis TaxID=44574 RepID=UPI0015A586A6|nr:hypothetical protein [Nitrosomonas communis]